MCSSAYVLSGAPSGCIKSQVAWAYSCPKGQKYQLPGMNICWSPSCASRQESLFPCCQGREPPWLKRIKGLISYLGEAFDGSLPGKPPVPQSLPDTQGTTQASAFCLGYSQTPNSALTCRREFLQPHRKFTSP